MILKYLAKHAAGLAVVLVAARSFAQPSPEAADWSETVGRSGPDRTVLPVNQVITPAGKQGEDGSRRDDIMEMRDDVIRVVQVNVADVEAQRQTGQPAHAEHGQERHRKQHWRVEADGAAPE